MIYSNELIELLDDYGIDGKKLIENNPNVLAYAKKEEVIREVAEKVYKDYCK